MQDNDARLSRRALISGVTVAAGGFATGTTPGFAQTPAASPVAAPANDQIALYVAARDDLLAKGRAFIDSLVSGDDETFASHLSPELADLFEGTGARAFMESIQSNRVGLGISRLGVWIDLHFDGTSAMSGFFYQGASSLLMLETEEPQAAGVPQGTWTGAIGTGPASLDLEVTFSGTADALAATLAVPAQGIANLPFDRATFSAQQPLGAVLDEAALPVRPAGNLYRVAHEWGDGILVINAEPGESDTWVSIELQATLPLPPDPAAGIAPAGEYRLPADVQMLAGWGGDTEFRNYHASTPVQRHANDLVVWRDGGTCPEGAGLVNEDYFIWGVPLVAPVAGTVVDLINDLPDVLPAINPESATSIPAGPVHPAGNHVVIEVAETEYVFLCHMQEASVIVAAGDTVQAGDPIGLAGNSGNTTEPHIHIHVQTTASMFDPAAIGLPLVFQDVRVDGAPEPEAAAIQGSFIEPA